MPFLEISSILTNLRLPGLATPLFNRPTRGILPRFNRQLVLYDNYDKNLIGLIDI